MNTMLRQEDSTMTPDEKMELEKMRAAAMSRQGDVEEMEDEAYAMAAPKGKFSGKVANALVEATNRLLPLFGLTDKYERFDSAMMTELPVDFVRLLSMFKAAVDDAVAEGVLPEDAVIELSVIKDDAGLQGLAGRIGMAAKSPGFKRFLMRKVKEAPEMEEEESDEPTSEEEMSEEDLFMSRM
jgi:hypothetical protein